MFASANWRGRVARITSMPLDEIRVRTTQEAYKRWDLALSKVGTRQIGSKRDMAFATFGRFFFQSSDIPEILECVHRSLPAVVSEIVEAADEILNHHFDLLGYEGVDYGRKIDWHLDAVNGRTAPRVPWYQVPYLAFDQVGDHKIIWELNRHQHLLTLAKAYRLTQNKDYANELIAQWYHWQEQNPYPIGINWASSLEVAFRSLSWLWIWHLLEGSACMSAAFRCDLIWGLTRNGRHIERYLSTYFAPNTHLLGEAVALFFIGTLLPKNRAVQRWQNVGWRIVLREATRQVLPDGMHFEQSTYYHVYALDFLLHARILADVNGIVVPAEFDQTVERMLKALHLLCRAGVPPQFGDDDGGRVFDPRRNHRHNVLDPLAVGTVLFRRPEWKAVVQLPTEEMIWLLGSKAVPAFEALSGAKSANESAALSASGIYVMSDSSAVQQQLVIDAGPQGTGWAGHGHADALSVQLATNGKPILIDPGTFSYVSSSEERERFRGTHSHSTVRIDGTNQAESAGPFKWTKPANANVEKWINEDSFDLFIASHSGYSRLSNPVTHRRAIFYLKSQFWVVRDVLEGTGVHDVDISWSFAPGSLASIANSTFFRGLNGAMLTAIIAANDQFKCDSSQNWYSPRYGEKHIAPQLRASAKLQLPAECATVLLPSIRADVRFDKMHSRVDGKSGAVVHGYSILMGKTVHEVFFSDSLGHWSVGPIASDASVLYCSRVSAVYNHVVACNATSVTLHDRRILSSSRCSSKLEWFEPADNDTPTLQLSSDGILLSGIVEEHA
ncbi:MAG: alginate lyase family protein [Candidatus Acidiferrales bacterium]